MQNSNSTLDCSQDSESNLSNISTPHNSSLNQNTEFSNFSNENSYKKSYQKGTKLNDFKKENPLIKALFKTDEEKNEIIK